MIETTDGRQYLWVSDETWWSGRKAIYLKFASRRFRWKRAGVHDIWYGPAERIRTFFTKKYGGKIEKEPVELKPMRYTCVIDVSISAFVIGCYEERYFPWALEHTVWLSRRKVRSVHPDKYRQIVARNHGCRVVRW